MLTNVRAEFEPVVRLFGMVINGAVIIGFSNRSVQFCVFVDEHRNPGFIITGVSFKHVITPAFLFLSMVFPRTWIMYGVLKMPSMVVYIGVTFGLKPKL